MRARWLHIANAVLLIALFAFSFAVYPDLPERIPLHFGPDGQADRWGDRTLVSWLLLPLIGAGTVALLYGVMAWCRRRPDLLNVPDKKTLLSLPREQQVWVIDGVANSLYATATGILVMFGLLHYGAWRVAHGLDGGQQMMAGLLIGLIAVPVISLSALVVVQRRIDAARREQLGMSAQPV